MYDFTVVTSAGGEGGRTFWDGDGRVASDAKMED